MTPEEQVDLVTRHYSLTIARDPAPWIAAGERRSNASN
jgi:hypothetical protein